MGRPAATVARLKLRVRPYGAAAAAERQAALRFHLLDTPARMASAASAVTVDAASSSLSATLWPWSCHEKPRVLVIAGPTGVGKCFARGTQLRLYSGDLIAVENVVGGEQLMGDDGTARTVTPGSLTPPGSRGVLYTVTPHWEGAEPFTVNGEHILVLVNNVRPQARQQRRLWLTEWWELDTANVLRVRQSSHASEEGAVHEAEQRLRDWAPLEWEVSMRDFLAAPLHTRNVCELMAADAVTFVNPQLPGLAHVLSSVLGQQPTQAQIDWAAWCLGLWTTGAWADRAADVSHCGSHWQILAELHRYQLLFGEQVTQQFDEKSTAGHPASVLRLLLQQYGLIDRPRVPQAWITDTLDVRRRIFAGIMDGDGCRFDGDCYEIAARQLLVAQGYRLLGASLGLRSGRITLLTTTDRRTGLSWDSYRQVFSGPMRTVSLHVVCSDKKSPQPGAADSGAANADSRCYGFSIAQQPVGDYFGFAVHGGANRRFLLADFTITHNSALSLRVARLLDGEVVSADSVQMYRQLNVGSNKLQHERRDGVVHHLIDVADLQDDLTVADFHRLAVAAIADISSRGKLPIVTGGSMLYLRWLLYGQPLTVASDADSRQRANEFMVDSAPWDTKLAALGLSSASVAYLESVRRRRCSQRLRRALEIVFLSSCPPPPLSLPSLPELPARLQYDARCVLLTGERSWLCRRLDFRCEEMIRDGLLEETRSLSQLGRLQASTQATAIGYRQAAAFLSIPNPTVADFYAMLSGFQHATRQYLRRQLTFFRSEPVYRFLRVPTPSVPDSGPVPHPAALALQQEAMQAVAADIARLAQMEPEAYWRELCCDPTVAAQQRQARLDSKETADSPSRRLYSTQLFLFREQQSVAELLRPLLRRTTGGGGEDEQPLHSAN